MNFPEHVGKRAASLAVALLAAGALPACGSGRSSEPRPKMSTAEIAHLPEFKISARSGPPPRRLIVHDVRKGSGAVMKRGDGILVDWAETAYGEALKAPPKREGQPERLPFDGILEGWEEGLPGMKVGGRRELIVPPSLGDLPVTMVYQVDLLAVEPRL